MALRDGVSVKTLSIIAMINILSPPTPPLLCPTTFLWPGSSISLLSNCLNPASDAWHLAKLPTQTIYIHSDQESMSLRCIKLLLPVKGEEEERQLVQLLF